MSEARDEAERIVYQACASEDVYRLVAALEAAIEWHDVMIGSMETDEEFVYHSMNATDVGLLQAVSALRAREGTE